MSNRVIKTAIWTCPFLAELIPFIQDQFPRWLLMADDYGCFDASVRVVKGLVYPCRPDVDANRVGKIKNVLNEQGQLFLWQDGGREWGYFCSWESPNGYYSHKTNSDDDGERARTRRKTPEPPFEELKKYVEHFGTLWNKRFSSIYSNKINNSSNLEEEKKEKRKKKKENVNWEAFEKFWQAYPESGLKSRGKAERMWKNLNPDESLIAIILLAVEASKTLGPLHENNGKFIPYAATWLEDKRWLDENKQGVTSGKSSEFNKSAGSGGPGKDRTAGLRGLLAEAETQRGGICRGVGDIEGEVARE